MKKIVAILFLLMLPAIVVSGEPDSKIGPLLHGKIDSSQPPTSDKKAYSLQTPTSGNQQPSEELTKVIVVMDRYHLAELPQQLIDELKTKVIDLGGYIGNHSFNNVQVWIPLDKIKDLAEWSEIKIIKLPTKPDINSGNVLSEGFYIGNVNNWNDSNITGQGVKVGVFDLGFIGYNNLLGTELPSDTSAAYTGSIFDFYSTEHGTACAEIVHDIAPDAALFLINSGDLNVEFSIGVNSLKQQGVDIISSSFGLNNLTIVKSTYDILSYSGIYFDWAVNQLNDLLELQDQINYIVSNTVAGGITWVQAANNNGRQRWAGTFSDTDNDGYQNFSWGFNRNELILPPSFSYGKTIYVSLAWGQSTDFVTYDDYDLSIVDEYGYTITSSMLYQSKIPFGMEACKFNPISGKRYFIKIKKWSATPQKILLLVGTDTFAKFENYSSEKTVNLSTPSANPDVICVGAVPYYSTSEIENFSGQGPGDNGIIKPDLVAPDAVSTVSYGDNPFYGTSAAAPHVAGVAALVKQKFPNYGPEQIKNYLEMHAKDLGVPGKDNVFGSGLVQLPIEWNYISTYEKIQWGTRGSDTYYSVDIFDGAWNTLYSAIDSGENLHSFSPYEKLTLSPGTYYWKVWSPSVTNYWEYQDGFQGQFTVLAKTAIKNSDQFVYNGFGAPNLVLSGDFDGNGSDDVLWYESSLSKATAFLSTGAHLNNYSESFCLNGFNKPNHALVGDFNGDGFDDILWYEESTFQARVFLSNGIKFVQDYAFSLNGFGCPDISLVGDFNGDGLSDILWYESSISKTAIFLSTGMSFSYDDNLSLEGFAPPDAALVGDFNGDGLSDLLWYEGQRSKATAFVSDGTRFNYDDNFCLNGFGYPDISALSDFDGDGISDLLWYNKSEAKLNCFLSDKTQFNYSDSLSLSGMGMPDYSIFGDFDGNGKTDMMWYEAWQNKASFFLFE